VKGRIHSIQSLGTVDGPGVRSVIFLSGCPLRCDYCHNPDTWNAAKGEEAEDRELAERILRFYPYIRNGGVTFSGGEPCLQAAFVGEVAKRLRDEGLHIALDTCGNVWNEDVAQMLDVVDLVLLDVKYSSEEEYANFTGGSLEKTLHFLQECQKRDKEVWIRQVIVPNRNDDEASMQRLAALIAPFECITRVELLPFRKLCLEKYQALGISFPLANTPAADPQKIKELEKHLLFFREKEK